METPTPTLTAIPRVEIAAVGDIMLARTLARRIQNNDGASIFRSVAPVISSADLTLGNLECALGEDGLRESKAYALKAPPEAAGVLHDAGFDLLSLANNHIMDYGERTFTQTLILLKENGIAYVGAGLNEQQAREPSLFLVRGLRVGFLAYADIPVEYLGFDARSWIAGPGKPGIAWAIGVQIQQDILAVRPSVDFLLVMLHFGVEGKELVVAEQAALAHLAIDTGADVVLGTHPHLVQPMEEYQGGLIAYSLGNFVFDDFQDDANRSIILWIMLSGDGSLSYRSIPVQIVDGVPTLAAEGGNTPTD
jgi:poly-gamma-glutamate synthesis protein (capsule biosynthesis protein)